MPNKKPKLTTEEQERAKILHAEGRTFNHIAGALGRSPHTVRKYLIAPEIAEEVRDEKKELADLYQAMAKKSLEHITTADLEKSSALQKATVSGICLDKSLALRGEGPGINVNILIEVLDAIREARDGEDEAEYQKRHVALSKGKK